jgi:hypothetical protein
LTIKISHGQNIVSILMLRKRAPNAAAFNWTVPQFQKLSSDNFWARPSKRGGHARARRRQASRQGINHYVASGIPANTWRRER